tara:strand:+ start:234 stop:416 length:183 start_codon:yes stop_codon:yes gene_type:complete
MENDKQFKFFNREILKEWYLKKGFILIDIFIIVALIQYFVFDGSFNDMIVWVKGFFQYYF